MLVSTGNVSTDEWRILLLETMESIPTYTLVPRFILSLRALYARDLQGRRGSESNIDIAFGFTSAFGHGVAASAIVFVGDGQNEGLEQEEEMQMEEREIHGAGTSA